MELPDTQVDSIVLILPIDTATAFYGGARNFPLDLRLLAGSFDQEQNYYSDLELPTLAESVNRDASFFASEEFTFLYDTIYSNGDTVAFPHVRIALSDAFVAAINAADTSDFSSDEDFWNLFPGVYLEPEAGSNGLVNLRPDANRGGQTAFSGFYFFYPDTSSQEPQFIRRSFSAWLPAYKKDYTGTLAATLLADGDEAEQTLVAGQGGLLTEITFPDLSLLDDRVVNLAEIKFFRDEVDGYSYVDNPSPTNLALFYRDDEGTLIPIEDRLRLGNPNSSDQARRFLGGDPQVNDAGDVFYQPRFSVHLQRMLDGEVPNVVYLRVVPNDLTPSLAASLDPSRVVLTGREAAALPATIRVTFTELD